MTCFLLLNYLVKFVNMHRIENFLQDSDLTWWSNVHALLLQHCNITVLFCVYTIYAQRVVLSVILERLNLQCRGKSLVLNLRDTDSFLFDLAMTSSCNVVVD